MFYEIMFAITENVNQISSFLEFFLKLKNSELNTFFCSYFLRLEFNFKNIKKK